MDLISLSTYISGVRSGAAHRSEGVILLLACTPDATCSTGSKHSRPETRSNPRRLACLRGRLRVRPSPFAWGRGCQISARSEERAAPESDSLKLPPMEEGEEARDQRTVSLRSRRTSGALQTLLLHGDVSDDQGEKVERRMLTKPSPFRPRKVSSNPISVPQREPGSKEIEQKGTNTARIVQRRSRCRRARE